MSTEKIEDEHIQEVPDRHIAVHTETFDISEDAIGNELPKNYYQNWRFIGVVTVRKDSHLLKPKRPH